MKDLTVKQCESDQSVTRTIADLHEFLYYTFKISDGVADFIDKVDFGLNDETSSLDEEDRLTLTEWYTNLYRS